MIKKLKEFFRVEDGPDLSRRKFIKGAASLAALTAVATTLPSISKFKEIQEQLLSGVVENQAFYIYEPVVIDLPNTVVRNCRFVACADMPNMITIKDSAKQCRLEDCHIDDGGFTMDACVRVEPQEGDMTNTLQSAMDTATPNTYCGEDIVLHGSQVIKGMS